MTLHTLQKIVDRSKKRPGRGHGSGKVKTSGRGTKGQKSRGTVHHGFEGGQVSLTHRLPFLRGKGRNDSFKLPVVAVPLKALHVYKANQTVSLETLRTNKIIGTRIRKVKLIGNTIAVAVKVEGLTYSQGAKAAIEKAGGKVV